MTDVEKLLAEVREMVGLLTSGEASFDDFYCGTIEGNLDRLVSIIEVQQEALALHFNNTATAIYRRQRTVKKCHDLSVDNEEKLEAEVERLQANWSFIAQEHKEQEDYIARLEAWIKNCFEETYKGPQAEDKFQAELAKLREGK